LRASACRRVVVAAGHTLAGRNDANGTTAVALEGARLAIRRMASYREVAIISKGDLAEVE